jgi:hypothetical protein
MRFAVRVKEKNFRAWKPRSGGIDNLTRKLLHLHIARCTFFQIRVCQAATCPAQIEIQMVSLSVRIHSDRDESLNRSS